jgi:predicted phosphohydrolase
MKIQYCSDLHLEFVENKQYLKVNPILPVGDILLLAGDITLLRTKESHNDFFKYLSKKFKAVYWIPGNHEYYHSDLATINLPLYEKIFDNIFLLNNKTIVYDNVEIIFSTLWSHIPARQEWTIQKGVSDFFYIKNDGKTIVPKDFNKLHEADLEFIKTEIAKSTNKKRVVVTHHVPTFQHYPPQYKNSEISGAFATELYDVIESSDVDYWIYGHHHCNTPDFKIGNTVMITNQLGYVRQRENLLFDAGRVVEI